MPTWEDYQRTVKAMTDAVDTHLPELLFEADMERRLLEIRVITNLSDLEAQTLNNLILKTAQALPYPRNVIVPKILDQCYERFQVGQTYLQIVEWLQCGHILLQEGDDGNTRLAIMSESSDGWGYGIPALGQGFSIPAADEESAIKFMKAEGWAFRDKDDPGLPQHGGRVYYYFTRKIREE